MLYNEFASPAKLCSFCALTVVNRMNRVMAVIAVVFLATLCGISNAQDRGAASSIAWSPDGERIAVASTTGLWLFDGHFNEVGNLDLELDTVSLSSFVEWNSTGDLLAFSGQLQTQISIVDVRELQVITEIVAFPWSPVIWHPTADRIVSGTLGGDTRMWDALTGEEVFHFDSMAEYSSDGILHETLGLCWFNEKALTIVSPQRIFVVDVDDGTILEEFGPTPIANRNADCNLSNQVLSVDGRLFDLEDAAVTWDFIQGRKFGLPERLPVPAAVRWSPDSRLIAANLTGCLTRVYNGQTGNVIAGMPGGLYNLGTSPYFYIDSIAWHPDGTRFAVVGQFGDIRVWDAKTFELLMRYDGFGIHPTIMAYLEETDNPGQRKCA